MRRASSNCFRRVSLCRSNFHPGYSAGSWLTGRLQDLKTKLDASQQELQPAPQLAPRPLSPVAVSQSQQVESAAPLPSERDAAMNGGGEEEPDWGGMDLEIEDARDRAKVCSGGCVGYGCEASPAALKRTHHSAPAGHQTSSSIKLRFTFLSGFSDLSCPMNA